MEEEKDTKLSLLLIGAIWHTLSVSDIEYLPLQALGVQNGKIIFSQPIPENKELSRAERINLAIQDLDNDWNWKEESQFLSPGLIDTHIHAPQFVFTGTGYDLSLLQWLETYTFPREAEFKNTDHADHVYHRVVRHTLRSGTTTACYYATTHRDSSIKLAEICAKLGQRAYIGKVCMDRNSPDYYKETTQESIQETTEFVKHIIDKIADPLIAPCITPRFVPSCTPELMQSLGDLAKEYNLPIQSHLSETPNEIKWVAELHPDISSYSGVYDKYNLLTSKTIMAHCVHLSEEERKLLKEKKVGISHCANSNFCLHSGMLDVRQLIEEGHDKIGLGTDVAGGYSPSIMDSMRQSLIASKVCHINHQKANPGKDYTALNFAEVFYLATLGGAKTMDLDSKIGNFVVGKDFDALVVNYPGRLGKPLLRDTDPNYENVSSPILKAFMGIGEKVRTLLGEGDDLIPYDPHSVNIDQYPHDDHISLFEKFIYLGDDRNFERIYVAGNRIM
ncbi:hypothetical protein BC833DRAFT_613888 [Globomyces pollinis-pini]|nr:hypothetical protein BC833DRAFT_613888 [Globomyces pollinis-pini]